MSFLHLPKPLGWTSSFLLLLNTFILRSNSFQLKTPTTKNLPISVMKLRAKQTFIYDGGECESFLINNPSNPISTPRGSPENVGCVTFITSSSKKLIGILADLSTNEETIEIDEQPVYKNTVASIPSGISEIDAISTAAACLVGVHCGVPKINGVGGGEEGFYSGKAVVVGGNEYACFLAEALAALGIDTSIVSTGSINLKSNLVKTLGPAVMSNDDTDGEIGFCTAIGKFDSLIDTIANERKGGLISDAGSSVIQLLQSRHQCNNYISTLSKSQQIVKKDGVIFGPGKANAHVKSLENLNPQKCIPLIPSSGFGKMTLQVLLDNKIIYPSRSNKAIVTRGWSMKDFWEETSWPRDSNGSGVRFGMPVIDEEDLDAVFRREQLSMQRRSRFVEKEENDDQPAVQAKVEENPFVTQIVGTEDLADIIIDQRKDSVVFVAMRSCRTCKAINPIYTKIAREYVGKVMFAKADATGKVGKTLAASLGIESAPTFVLFKSGVRYGIVQTSKLPSDRLQKAISDLEAGKDFDPSCEYGDD